MAYIALAVAFIHPHTRLQRIIITGILGDFLCGGYRIKVRVYTHVGEPLGKQLLLL